MRYENRTFENETISVDGNQYIGCRFVDCTLTFAGVQPFEITPFSAKDLQFKFTGAAKAGQEVGNLLLRSAAEAAPVGSVLHLGRARFQKLDDGAADIAREPIFMEV